MLNVKDPIYNQPFQSTTPINGTNSKGIIPDRYNSISNPVVTLPSSSGNNSVTKVNIQSIKSTVTLDPAVIEKEDSSKKDLTKVYSTIATFNC